MKLDLRRKGVTRLALVVASLFLLPFLASTAAAAVAYDVTDTASATNPSCTAIPGATWAPHTCAVASLSLGSSDSLEVGSGVTLLLANTLTNFGAVTIDVGAVFIIDNAAVVNNAGSLAITGTTDNYGVVSSSTTIETFGGDYVNEASGTTNNNGGNILINTGTLENAGGGLINNNCCGALQNNFGFIGNDAGATLINAALIANFNTFDNGGTLTNTLSGLIENEPSGLFDNSASSISDAGTIKNLCEGNFIVGTITGNPIQFHPCQPVVTPGTFTTRSPTISGTSNLVSGGGVGSTTPMSIKLYEGVTQIGSAATDSSGNWNIVPTNPLASGLHTLTATATDAGSFISPNSDPALITIFLLTSTLASCTPTPFPVGTITTCTATVIEQSGTPSTAPTGIVGLSGSKPGDASADCHLSPTGVPGQSQCQDTFAPLAGSEGSIAITLFYSGDVGHMFSTASPFGVSATMLGTTTALSCPAFIVNTLGSCFGTVTDSPSVAFVPPTGSVTFTHFNSGAFTPGSGICTLSGLPPNSRSCFVGYTPALGSEGSHCLTASYGGDTDHTTSSSSLGCFTASKRSDATAVSCLPNPDVVNGPATCTATVTDTSPPTTVTPSGTATFSTSGSGSFSSTFCTLVSGSCSVTYTPHPGSEGTHTVTASYSGDTDHFTSSGTFGLTVAKRSTSAGLACTGALDVGNPETCTITVTDSSLGTKLTPMGKVTFKIHPLSGPTITRTCTLVAGVLGTASCHVTFSPTNPPGSWTVMATYPGDGNHLKASTSVVLVISA